MRASIPATLALFVAAAPAGAAEFVPGWTTEGVWTSNVFRSLNEDQFGESIPKEDDFSARFGPDLLIREGQGDLRWELGYQLRYEEFARLDGISDFDHFADGSLDWSITDRTSVSASNSFASTSSLGALFDALPETQATLVLRPIRERINTNSASASVRHSLGPLWEFTLTGGQQFYDYGGDTGSQSFSYIGTAQLTRRISRRFVGGFGTQLQRDESSSDIRSSDTGSTFAQAFAIANYSFSPTLRLAASAGPAISIPDAQTFDVVAAPSYVPVDVSSCPRRSDGTPFVPAAQAAGFQVSGESCRPLVLIDQNGTTYFPFSSSTNEDVPFVGETGVENSITYFARIELEKDWRNWRSTLGYTRSASNSSGLSVSTFVDSVVAQLIWTPSPKWSLSLLGTISMQSSISEVRAQQVAVNAEPRDVSATTSDGQIVTFPDVLVGVPFEVSSGDTIDNPIEIRTTRIELRGERRITKNLFSTASGSWYQQTNSGQLQENGRSEYRVVVGMTWKFDPIPL